MNHGMELRALVVSSPFILLVICALVACAAPAQTTVQRMGLPRPPRGDNCDLTLVTSSDTWPGGKYYPEFETIGIVNVNADNDNAQPSDPDVKQKLKPQACSLGGELIALISSNEKHNRYGGKLSGRYLSFQVLARKATVTEQQY
jgi:hypothetical protein